MHGKLENQLFIIICVRVYLYLRLLKTEVFAVRSFMSVPTTDIYLCSITESTPYF